MGLPCSQLLESCTSGSLIREEATLAMDRLQQVLSQGVVVDKVEEEEQEEAEVPSLDPISGDRVSALAKLLVCSFLVWISILGSYQLECQCMSRCVP